MELFIILLKGLASVFIYLKFIPFLEEGSQEAEEDFPAIKRKE